MVTTRRHGAISKEGLIGAVLVALIGIAVAIALQAWLVGPDTSRDPAWQRAHMNLDFECELCGHKFRMAPHEFHKQWKDVDPSKLPLESRHKANCPKCGKPYCCRITTELPSSRPLYGPSPQAR